MAYSWSSISEDAINGTVINAGPGQSSADSHNQSSLAVAQSAAPSDIAGITFLLVSTALVFVSVRVESGVGIISALVFRIEATIKRETEPDREVPSGTAKAVATSPFVTTKARHVLSNSPSRPQFRRPPFQLSASADGAVTARQAMTTRFNDLHFMAVVFRSNSSPKRCSLRLKN